MRLLGRCVGGLALALAAACSSADATSSSADAGPSGSAHAPVAVAFDLDGPLTLAPGALRSIDVRVTPPARASVRFALLGDALDASLDRVSVDTDASGRGSVNLRAPDAATTFRLRAGVEGGGSAEASIAVSDQGFATVEVVPMYAGKRAHASWTASIVARATCASLQATSPADPPGGLTASSATTPLVSGVPVGPSLAVVIRSGHAMWGCTDTAALTANQTTTVKVNVVDRPIDLTSAELDLTFAYAPDPETYDALLAATTARLAAVAFPEDGEGGALLDAMAAALPAEDADVFAKERVALGWDTAVDAALGPSGTAVRHWVESLAKAGLAAQTPTMAAHLAPIPGATGHALFELRRLGDVDAGAAGVPSAHLVSFAAAPDDALELGGTLYWLPSRYVGAAAIVGAKAAVPGAKSVADALATLASCADVASLLGSAGQCDAACLEAACRDAIAARWALALDASITDGDIGEISITATASAELDANAAPTGFVGSWLGAVRAADLSASASGVVSATSPGAPPPY
jgi:hypothetical protein